MRNLKALCLTLAACLAVPAAALAGAPAPAPAPAPVPPGPAAPAAPLTARLRLTLEEAVSRALASQERIAVARAGLERSDAAVGEAWSGALPALSGSASFARSKREIALVGGIPTATGAYSNLYSATAQLSQPLFTGGAVWNGVAAARARRGASAEDLRTSRQLTVYRASRFYYDAALAREVHKVVQASYELAKRHYEEMQAREKAGTASKFDLLRAKVAMQNQEAEVINADNSARLAQAALLRETGLPQETELELVTGFGAPSPAPALAEVLRAAAENRPELASAGLGVKAQESTVRAAYSGYLPNISATASWGGSSGDDPFQNDNFTEGGTVGVQAQWTLFDGFLTRARVAENKADLARLEYAAAGLRRDIDLEVRQALLNLESARQFIASQGANVEEAGEALRLAEARQKAGAGTELDIQDARTALEQARLNYAKSLYQYSVARLDINKATGLLPAPGNGK